jgi:transposase-like protein
VRLYFRFTLSLRDIEELMALRGVDASYETIRCWTIKSCPIIARNLNRRKLADAVNLLCKADCAVA